MQWFLEDLESRLLKLEAHHLALAMAKKTWDENHRQRTTIFQDRQKSLFQKQAARKMEPEMETWI